MNNREKRKREKRKNRKKEKDMQQAAGDDREGIGRRYRAPAIGSRERAHPKKRKVFVMFGSTHAMMYLSKEGS